MFTRIARRYDFMNCVITAGQDGRWRRTVIQEANLPERGKLLDIATGTGEIALEGLRKHPDILAIGGDFTFEMMRVGKVDLQRKGIKWAAADTLSLPFPDKFFDAVTSGFLMRNVIDVPGALREQIRVTKPGGRIVILESSPPKRNPLRPFIRLHLNYVIPMLGQLITGDREAYKYLPDSTLQFQSPEELADLMEQSGLARVKYELFMFGSIAIHVGVKSE